MSPALKAVPFVLATVLSAPASSAETLSLPQAVETALKQTPEIAGARAGVDSAEHQVGSAKALRYPSLRAEGNVLRWNKPLVVRFGGMDMGGGMQPASPPFVAREQVTTSLSLTVAQPLTGLFALSRQVTLNTIGVAQAQAQAAQTTLDVAERAAAAYLNVLAAQAVADVATKAVAQIEGQLERAQKQQAAGALNKVDVLRLASARDTAKQDVVNAQKDVDVARGQLALALNVPVERLPEVVDDLADPPPPLTATGDDVLKQAEQNRPEIRSAAEQIRQATAAQSVAKADYLPNINAVGTYQHVTGQGPFQPRSAWFIGATLSWDIWSWGSTYEGVKAAEARAAQAQHAAQSVRNQVVVQARQRLLETQAAYANLEPARTALEAATEAHRIQSLRYSEGVATTTDILAAETELTRARAGYAQARYRCYQAQVGLARAMGKRF